MSKGAKNKPIAQNAKPYQVAIGSEFPVEDAITIDAKSRRFLTKTLVIYIVVAMSCGGVLGIITGSYNALIAIWSVAGPFVGAIVAYYYKPERKGKG